VKLTVEQKEARRLEAAKDLAAGMAQADVARKYGVRKQTVHIWKAWVAEGGVDRLKSRPKTGRPPKISKQDTEKLVKILLAGPRKQGFRTDAWNSRRAQQVILDKFGVEYNVTHVPKLLRALGFRPRMPDRQAIEKDPVKKKQWLDSTWELAKKN
jgi:putative transposase